MSEVVWEVVAYDDPRLQALLDEVQGEYVVRYGGPDATPIDPAGFAPPSGLFLLGTVHGEAVACGAYRRHQDGVAEIKRMYVRPDWRRRGIARDLLTELETRAAGAGYLRAVLETGLAQPEALAMYPSAGWIPIPGYGHYKGSPRNRCFAKVLSPAQVQL